MAILYALIAALGFGLSAPLAKLLLASASPLLLAGLLYLGAGAFLGLALACVLWALGNNLTSLIAEGDPLLIVMVKGLGAGTVNTVLALAAGESLPGPRTIGLGMALGAVSYGTSLALFILAMRDLGAARTGAYFATAPFFGAAGGILLLDEPPTPGLLVAAGLMALATWLLVGERHAHTHRHAAASHAHVHVTDAH